MIAEISSALSKQTSCLNLLLLDFFFKCIPCIKFQTSLWTLCSNKQGERFLAVIWWGFFLFLLQNCSVIIFVLSYIYVLSVIYSSLTVFHVQSLHFSFWNFFSPTINDFLFTGCLYVVVLWMMISDYDWVMQCLALLPHSKQVLGSNPLAALYSLRLCGFSQGFLVSSHSSKWMMTVNDWLLFCVFFFALWCSPCLSPKFRLGLTPGEDKCYRWWMDVL